MLYVPILRKNTLFRTHKIPVRTNFLKLKCAKIKNSDENRRFFANFVLLVIFCKRMKTKFLQTDIIKTLLK